MENLLQKAKDLYGTSKKCNLSTFLLPDGEVLNTTKYFSQHPDFHVHELMLKKLQKKTDIQLDERYKVLQFVNKTGSIRVRPSQHSINLSIDINNPITDKQIEYIEKCSCFFKKGKERPVYYDFFDGVKLVSFGTTGNEVDCFKGIDKLKKDFKKYYNEYGKKTE